MTYEEAYLAGYKDGLAHAVNYCQHIEFREPDSFLSDAWGIVGETVVKGLMGCEPPTLFVSGQENQQAQEGP